MRSFDPKLKALCRFDVFAIDKRLGHQLTELLGLIRRRLVSQRAAMACAASDAPD